MQIKKHNKNKNNNNNNKGSLIGCLAGIELSIEILKYSLSMLQTTKPT